MTSRCLDGPSFLPSDAGLFSQLYTERLRRSDPDEFRYRLVVGHVAGSPQAALLGTRRKALHRVVGK